MIDPSIEYFMVAGPGNETARKIGAINTRALDKLTALQMDYARFGIQTGLAQTRLLTNVDNYSDFLSMERKISQQCYDQLMKISKQATALIINSGDKYFEVLDEFFSAVQTAPDDVTKSTRFTNTADKAVEPAKKPLAKNSARSRSVSKQISVGRKKVKKKSK
jgi:nitrous oxide reductase